MAAGTVMEFGAATSRARHGLIVALALLVLGAWVLLLGGQSIPDRFWVGLLALGLGGVVGLHTWWTARRAGVRLRLDDRGVWLKDWGVTVPWDEIADVYQTGHRLQPFVSICIDDPARFIASLSEQNARKLQGERLWKAPELRIPNGAVDLSQQELLDLLHSALKRQPERHEAAGSFERGHER